MRALILTAGGLNLETLINAAGNVGVDSAWVITSNAGDSIVHEPPLPDFVIAVLNPRQDASPTLKADQFGPGTSPFDNLDIALRAGRAAGQGFPVLLIVPPPLPRPADLLGAVVAPCPLDDFGVLRLHLWAFVSTLPGRAHLEAGEPVHQPTTFDATSVLDQLSRINPADRLAPRQVEQLVVSLLSQVGAETVENPERGERIDFAVLPTRTSSNVLLVEVAVGRLTDERLARAELQLQAYVANRHTSLGLVLYHDFEGKHWPSRQNLPDVIRMSVRELIAGLATNTLPQLIGMVTRDAARRL